MGKSIKISQEDTGTLHITLAGDWLLTGGLENPATGIERVSHADIRQLVVDGRDLGEWDSTLVSYLLPITAAAQSRRIGIENRDVPEGVVRLIALAQAIPARPGQLDSKHKPDFTERIGSRTLSVYSQFIAFATFIGTTLVSIGHWLRGKAVYRRADLLAFLSDCGPASLGIVTLISVLIGMILAFVGAVQLERFGASIYVASLVGLAMAREMAPMMTGIIMAGRTGAAFAAQLGSMQVNEEIDALKTMGVAPADFLVLPRTLALVIMMPLLTIYANLMGILGGGLVSVVMLDLSWTLYFEQMIDSVPLRHFAIGLFKSVIFGILIALAGCYMGMNSGRSATAVGRATTAAVVLGIVLIIVFDALVTIVTTVLGI
ncbi:ABC transporter permease [Exilibacterium tricleocarpae]|uniref:ABC transporter permease n=1 Tax=Exilibacterium tricleocarpae TaxID=2591008 RepID=A0A545UA83_9GAMM|nr:ABC transporter permease [Exilibacterium tricleocarpae]